MLPACTICACWNSSTNMILWWINPTHVTVVWYNAMKKKIGHFFTFCRAILYTMWYFYFYHLIAMCWDCLILYRNSFQLTSIFPCIDLTVLAVLFALMMHLYSVYGINCGGYHIEEVEVLNSCFLPLVCLCLSVWCPLKSCFHGESN